MVAAAEKFHLECQLRWFVKDKWRRNGVFEGGQGDNECDLEFELELDLELKVNFEQAPLLNFRSNLSYLIAGNRGTTLL